MADLSPQGIQKERSNRELQASYDYKLPRRLVVCLDGTWNKRDSGTNVFHLSNLIQEGRVEDQDAAKDDANKKPKEWFQIVYYDEGVGTGILDGITGGAFGLGLSENIREAYDWLVEQYRDGDEIYIFGFSRGAFTARSLSGLIAKCGLLSRGAPIPPEQLWSAYRILGRHENPRTAGIPSENWWERIVGRQKKPFLPIRSLKRDAGESEDAKPDVEKAVRRTELLLLKWSRRVEIKCLGVFDTVGSMGVDALAIPWLRDKVAQFHDTQISVLAANAFHALAIDEHRANFPHIPWHRPVNAQLPPGGTPRNGRVEQRWFVGAHSNVGGGYGDDMLAQFPLQWMIEQCKTLGLKFQGPPPGDPTPPVAPASECVPLLLRIKGQAGFADTLPQLRDSFADIAKGIWKGIIRSKREYRRIGPPPEFQNAVNVLSINETLDGSVLELLREDHKKPGGHKRYNPPNLWEYCLRKIDPKTLPSSYERPKNRYIEGVGSFLWLIAWLLGVGLAAAAVVHLRGGRGWDWLWPAVIASVFAFAVDLIESTLNHRVALHPDGLNAECKKAFIKLFLAFRLVILGAILAGIVLWLVILWRWLISVDSSGRVWWLLLLDAIILYWFAAKAWTAASMKEAGFGSILSLQLQFSSSRACNWLNRLCGKDGTDEERKQSLMPVAHTLFRDMFAYIPTYVSALFAGHYFLYLLATSPSSSEWRLLDTFVANWPRGSLLIIGGGALADYIEDIAQLSYLKIFPRCPSPIIVAITNFATVVKFVLLAIAQIGFVVAAVWLTVDQVGRLFASESGALSLVALALPALLVISFGLWLMKEDDH